MRARAAARLDRIAASLSATDRVDSGKPSSTCDACGLQLRGVSRLYSPAIQRGISTLYHFEKRFSLGPPGRFVQASSRAQVGHEVVAGGEARFARGGREQMALERRGVAAGHGDRLASESRAAARPVPPPKKRFAK